MEDILTAQRAPGFRAGFLFLYLASFGLAGFGVAGWVLSDANMAQRIILGLLTACSAGVIPATVVALGRSWASASVLAPVVIFGAIGAYSFHHAVEVLVEAPRKAGWMAEADRDYAQADTRYGAAQARVDALPPLALDPDMPKGRVQAQQGAWAAQQATLQAAADRAMVERTTAKAARDARQSAYQPLAPDALVWLLAILVDAGVALGIFGLEATRHAIQRRMDKAADAAELAKAKADADTAVAELISARANDARATVIGLREAAARIRGQGL